MIRTLRPAFNRPGGTVRLVGCHALALIPTGLPLIQTRPTSSMVPKDRVAASAACAAVKMNSRRNQTMPLNSERALTPHSSHGPNFGTSAQPRVLPGCQGSWPTASPVAARHQPSHSALAARSAPMGSLACNFTMAERSARPIAAWATSPIQGLICDPPQLLEMAPIGTPAVLRRSRAI